jgi:hypothetical protein
MGTATGEGTMSVDIYNENKFMQEAKEIWEKAYKPFMKWDIYWYQINEQRKVYLSLPEAQKPLAMKTHQYRAERTYRELQNSPLKRKKS